MSDQMTLRLWQKLLGVVPFGVRGGRRTHWVTRKGEVHVSNSLYHDMLTLSQAICHGLHWWLLQSMRAAGDPLCRQRLHAGFFCAALLVA